MNKQQKKDYLETLIYRFADAREKANDTNATDTYNSYWKGIADTTQTTLNDLYSNWTEDGTTGYYVFTLNKSYISAIDHLSRKQ